MEENKDNLHTVKVQKGGPLVITGKFRLILADGSNEIREGITAFCRCGQSKNMPYCDGSHVKSNFKD